MSTYHVGKRDKGKRWRIMAWLFVVCLIVGGGLWSWQWLRQQLKPQTTIKQSKAVTTTVSYDSANKSYTEPDFTVSLPAAWQPVARPPGTYQTYTWQTSDSETDGQQIQIFEDTIPVNFSVNRALIVAGENDHLTLQGSVSDNCSNFTRGTSTIPNEPGAPAKWQGVTFLCDQRNLERNVTGTSSTDGINTVILKTSQGVSHKFLFVYSNQSTNPDYTVFYDVLQSLRMN